MTRPARAALVGVRGILAASFGTAGLASAVARCGPPARPAGEQRAAAADSAPRWAEPACGAAERRGTADPGYPGSDTVLVATVGPGRPPFCIVTAFPRDETEGAVARTINGAVRVYRLGHRAAWQSFDLVESGYAPARLRDRDGDGWRDLEVLYFNGGPDTQYEYHVFDPARGRFADAAIREEPGRP